MLSVIRSLTFLQTDDSTIKENCQEIVYTQLGISGVSSIVIDLVTYIVKLKYQESFLIAFYCLKNKILTVKTNIFYLYFSTVINRSFHIFFPSFCVHYLCLAEWEEGRRRPGEINDKTVKNI